jgi:hypothetical protein
LRSLFLPSTYPSSRIACRKTAALDVEYADGNQAMSGRFGETHRQNR